MANARRVYQKITATLDGVEIPGAKTAVSDSRDDTLVIKDRAGVPIATFTTTDTQSMRRHGKTTDYSWPVVLIDGIVTGLPGEVIVSKRGCGCSS